MKRTSSPQRLHGEITPHKSSIFSVRDESPTNRPCFAAEPLLLVDYSGVRRPSSVKTDVSTMGPVTQESRGLMNSLRNYPPGVFFILGNEFCERFSFYGMRTILVLYLISEHNFRDSTASVFYHAFVSLAYLAPLLGSIAADNYVGRFKVILWVSLVYCFGHALLSVGAIPHLLPQMRNILDFGGLIVIALATGGIKPCVSAFAADQFKEEQQQERSQFFSFFYFAINAGSLVAIIVTPMLRGRVRCFDSEYCFPLAFGVPGVLMLAAFILFVAGIRWYKITPVKRENVIWKVATCITYAFRCKVNAKLKGQDSAVHWLDYASPRYSDSLINGVKSLVAIAVLFVPVAFFWALLDQQGSTWVLQARRMDGRVGQITILPDQMSILNPLFILLMVPLFEAFLYPAARRICVVTPLRKMALGGLLAALAFVIAGFLQLKINETLEPSPQNNHAFLQRLGNTSTTLGNLDGPQLIAGRNEWPAGDYDLVGPNNEHFNLSIQPQSAYVVGVYEKRNEDNLIVLAFPYKNEKTENGATRIYLMADPTSNLIGEQLFVLDHRNEINTNTEIRPGSFVDIKPTLISSPHYMILYGVGCSAKRLECTYKRPFFAQMGAAHVLDLSMDSHHSNTEVYTIVQPNRVHILWQIPQFVVIVIGEVLVSVTGLEFAYSQSSASMKSVLQAVWLMTTFFGNLIDMAIFGTQFIKEPATEFFIYAFLMILVIGVFMVIAMNYQYVDRSDLDDSIEEEEEATEKLKVGTRLSRNPERP
ncbi:Peptide transporter 3 [Aphelenchoides besseyi]|nr:Peptide transporter 3 [Aphelenchoides besseyi]